MECWRTGVQIPPTPPNTGGRLAHARPLETSIYAGSSSSPTFPYIVSDGLKRSPLGHKSGTSGTDSAQLLSPAEQATLRTKHLGTHECHLFRKEIFEDHPHLSLSMASSYLEIAKDKGYIQANQNLLAINDRLIVKDLNLSATPETLKKFAKEKALYVASLSESFKGDHGLAYKACCEYIKG